MGYWDGYTRGAQAGQQIANNILVTPIERQAAIEQLQAQRQANALGSLKAQQAQVAYQDMLGARKAAAEAQGVPEQSQTTIQPPQQTSPDSSAALGLMPQSVSSLPAPANLSEQTRLAENVRANPELARMTGADQRLSQMGAPTPEAVGSAEGFPGQEQPAASPIVHAYNEGRVQTTTTPAQPPNRTKAALDYYTSVGNLEEANKLKQQIMLQAKQTIDISGNPTEGLKIINESTGSNLTIMKTPTYEILKNGDEMIGILDEGTMKQDQMNGMPLSDALNKNLVPLNLGGSGKIVADYLAKNPDATPQDMWELSSKNNIPLKVIEPIITELQRAQSEAGKEERFNATQSRLERNHMDQMMRSDRNFALAIQRMGQGQGNNEDVSTVAQMLADGEINSADVPKRGNTWLKAIAEAKKINPGFDPQRSAADNKSMANLVKITGVLRSNEIEANKNFDQLSGLVKRLGNGSIPVLNAAANRIASGLGAPEPGTAEGVAYEAMTQYARVVNKQTTGGAITDTARKEANALLNVLKLTPKQFDDKLKQYRITMKNAMESQYEAIETSRSGKKPQTTPNIPSEIIHRVTSAVAEGKQFTFTRNGSTYTGVKKNGKLVFD